MTNRRPPEQTPEGLLRRRLHGQGLRFARNARVLPGQPELVLPRRRSVVFVRGCFWHGHGCSASRAAGRFNAGTWAEKIAANQAQDARDRHALIAAGWQVETVWECQADEASVVGPLAARLRER